MTKTEQTNAELIAEKIVLQLINNGAVCEKVNGKSIFKLRKTKSSPWRVFGTDIRKNCALWRKVIYIQMWHGMRGMVFIPKGCQECFKVVIRPKTWAEFQEVEKTLFDLGLPSKCGIEVRLTVKGYYGGYIYCVGLEEGRERYQIAREAIPDSVPVILKKGCTEFELEHGPSDKWEMSERGLEIETALDNIMELTRNEDPQSAEDLEKVKDRWREFAFKCDPTYGGPAHHAACVTYHG